MLRCKFRVDSVGVEAEARTLRMSAFIGNAGDNEDWSKWTPSGTFQIYVTNPAAFAKIDSMVVGEPYYIDVTPLPVAVA